MPPASSPNRPKLSRTASVELAFVLAFLALAAWRVLRAGGDASLPALDPAALATGPRSERWMGIYFQGQPVGWAMSAETPTADGGLLLQGRARFGMASQGRIQRVESASTALLDAERRLRRFDLVWDAPPMHLALRGEVRDDALHLEVLHEATSQFLDLPLEGGPPQLDLSLGPSLAGRELAVGQSFEIPFFDPLTLSQHPLEVRVVDVEVLPDGEEAYWLETRYQGTTTRRLVTPAGDVLREEGAMGLSLVALPREQALALGDREALDLSRLSAVEVDRPIERPRELLHLVVQLDGGPDELPRIPGVQEQRGARVVVDAPIPEELPTGPLLEPGALPPASELDEEPAVLRAALLPEVFLPSADPEMVLAAREIVGDADRREAARRLVDWVFREVRKAPVAGVPDGLEVLRQRVGDCNEHTALYVSLARAAGLPARILVGLVYADGEAGPAFYYHAWPEVYLGGERPWVPVDPTFGEFPADAARIALVRGNLDRQVEILGVMGSLHLRVLETR